MADGGGRGNVASPIPRSLASAIAYHLRVAQEASFSAFLGSAAEPDLRPGRYAVLAVLAHTPGCTPTALSQAVGRDKSTITATLRDLERHELVRRERRAEDQRSVGLHLTAAGQALLLRLRRHAAAHDRRLDRIVGAARKPDLIALLSQIAERIGQPGTRTLRRSQKRS